MPGTDQGLSGVTVPIVSSDRVIGSISLENFERENAFGESELRLLTTIAASLGTALENARLFAETQRLLKETEQRNAELAIINSVQAALAAKLDIQGIYDTVGDKIREMLHNADMGIRIRDTRGRPGALPLRVRGGRRRRPSRRSRSPTTDSVRRSIVPARPFVINENMAQAAEALRRHRHPGHGVNKSAVFVPLVGGDQRQRIDHPRPNSEREHAFGESDVRLLTRPWPAA